ncbi:MAG TPA: hypothetical protein VH561_10825 [Micromonosporaceae bacterium]|jgi:uncharacterized protein YxjI
MDVTALQGLTTLFVKQRFTLMVNRYEVWAADQAGNPTVMVAFAQQKRMALKEQVTLYTDDTKTTVVAGFKARQVIDLGATYDVTDGVGTPIGLFRKDFAKSLLRSTWHVEQSGLPPIMGQERSMLVALLRRFSDISFLPYHFDFATGGASDAGGTPVFSVEKKWGIRDKYIVSIRNPQIDRRLVIAMSVALDALQSR